MADNQKTGIENAGLNMTDNIARVEFAGLENDGLDNNGLTLRCLEYILLTSYHYTAWSKKRGQRIFLLSSWKRLNKSEIFLHM